MRFLGQTRGFHVKPEVFGSNLRGFWVKSEGFLGQTQGFWVKSEVFKMALLPKWAEKSQDDKTEPR